MMVALLPLQGDAVISSSTTVAFLGLLEGQKNQPKPHVDPFSEVMVSSTFELLASLTKMPNKDSWGHHCCTSTKANYALAKLSLPSTSDRSIVAHTPSNAPLATA